MAEDKKKSGSSGGGSFGSGINVNPCAALLLIYLVPPAILLWTVLH